VHSTHDCSPACSYLLTSTTVLFFFSRCEAAGHWCVIGSNVIVIHNRRPTLATTTTMHTQVVWDVTPCRLIISYRRFGGACCFHLQGIRRQHTPPKVTHHKSYCSTVHFRRITSIHQPTNAHIISHKTLLKHSKTLRRVSILSDHHQGALFLAKVILEYLQFNSYLQTRCCGSISCCVGVFCGAVARCASCVVRRIPSSYIVFDMFRTAKCSSSRNLEHAVLWYFLHASV